MFYFAFISAHPSFTQKSVWLLKAGCPQHGLAPLREPSAMKVKPCELSNKFTISSPAKYSSIKPSTLLNFKTGDLLLSVTHHIVADNTRSDYRSGAEAESPSQASTYGVRRRVCTAVLAAKHQLSMGHTV